MKESAISQIQNIENICEKLMIKLNEDSQKWNMCYYIGTLADRIVDNDKQYVKENWKAALGQIFGISSREDLDIKANLKKFISPFMHILKTVLNDSRGIAEIEPFKQSILEHFTDVKKTAILLNSF